MCETALSAVVSSSSPVPITIAVPVPIAVPAIASEDTVRQDRIAPRPASIPPAVTRVVAVNKLFALLIAEAKHPAAASLA